MINRPECLLLIHSRIVCVHLIYSRLLSELHVLVPIVGIFFPYRKICMVNQVSRSFFSCVHLEVEDIWSIRNSMLREWGRVGWGTVCIPRATLAQRRESWSWRARWEASAIARDRQKGLNKAIAIGLETKLTGTGN